MTRTALLALVCGCVSLALLVRPRADLFIGDLGDNRWDEVDVLRRPRDVMELASPEKLSAEGATFPRSEADLLFDLRQVSTTSSPFWFERGWGGRRSSRQRLHNI